MTPPSLESNQPLPRQQRSDEPLLKGWDYFDTKHIVLIFYLLCISGLYIPAFERSSRWGLGLTIGIHFLEFLAKIKVLRRAVQDDKTDQEVDETMRRGLFDHFILTMVYGYFHWSALEREQQEKDRSA